MSKKLMKSELKILLDALCDGFRQEVRQRKLTNLVTDKDFSILNEREQGVASVMAFYLRLLGFTVQVEAYFEGDPQRRPDFGIWLPASEKHIYIELKQIAWGDEGKQYYFAQAVEEVEKLNCETDPQNQLNGLIALGFSKSSESLGGLLWSRLNDLSQTITETYPYEQIGLRQVDLEGMDKQTSYLVIGLWFRK